LRIYYAHPIEFYHTAREYKELEIIREHFPGAEIVNPSTIRHPHEDIEFFTSLVDSCDIVVYSDLGGFITAGVATEVEYALDHDKPVYRLDWRTGEIVEVKEIKDVLTVEESRALIDIASYLLLDDVELAKLIKDKWRGNLMDTLSTIMSDPSLKRLDRVSEIDLVNILSRFYHWWQEPDNIAQNVDVRKLKEMVNEKLREYGERSLRSYMLKTLGLSKTRYDYYTYLLKEEKIRPIETETLRKLCKDFKIPYIELEKRKAIVDPNFPIDLNNPALFRAAIHVINEGHMRTKTKDVEYYNSDPVLHHYFKRAVEEAGSTFRGPTKAHNVLVSYADSLMGRLMNFIGVPYGSKSIKQPFMDLKRLDDDTWKYYLQATLTEEGNFYVEISRQKRLSGRIALTRAVDITDILPRSFVDSLDQGFHSIKDIEDRAIQKLIARRPPSLLMAEYVELNKRHRFVGQAYPWRHPFPERILKTKDGRVTVSWRLETRRRELVDLIHDHYGMLPGTWKAMVFEKLYCFYRDHRGRRLADYEVEELYRIREEFPWDVPEWWAREKLRELFGREL